MRYQNMPSLTQSLYEPVFQIKIIAYKFSSGLLCGRLVHFESGVVEEGFVTALLDDSGRHERQKSAAAIVPSMTSVQPEAVRSQLMEVINQFNKVVLIQSRRRVRLRRRRSVEFQEQLFDVAELCSVVAKKIAKKRPLIALNVNLQNVDNGLQSSL